MSNIIVRKSNGDMLEVTLLTLFGMLADENSHFDLMSRLNRAGFVTAELHDGTAQVWRAKPTFRQPASLLLEFAADTRLHFELPARIHCQASDRAEAAHIIEATVTGARGMPAGFKIELDPMEVQSFVSSLDAGNLAVVQDVTINHVHQRLLIGTDASP